MPANPEELRLEESNSQGQPWRKWGPYLSQRQWGTVREDYSRDGNAWDYFPHDQARSRAYRWGEDGLGGLCDDQQRLCFGLALWNGKDPILKERLFGLTNSEGNHGEDVKEQYYFLDSTPTHSFMRFLYKYPQAAYPYEQLVGENRNRNRLQPEYELTDTGVFDGDRYFDVFVEYAKASPEDILIRVVVKNHGPEAAELHVLPSLWFRNTWSWGAGGPKPCLKASGSAIEAEHQELGRRFLHCEGSPRLLFTENETNRERLWQIPNQGPFVKDGINNHVVNNNPDSVNPGQTGTKAAAHYKLSVPAGGETVLRLRLNESGDTKAVFGPAFDKLFATRSKEADGFYAGITPKTLGEDETRVMRQALAGMLWSKQFYYYDVDVWMNEKPEDPHAPPTRTMKRNGGWRHMVNADVISMPDTWEYPWYAAWDLAFHTVALAMVDRDFAHAQLKLMLRDQYMHANGQIPAYEWNFSDVNPPVHAWAAYFVFNIEKEKSGEGDLEFLKYCFQKLLLNFTWWVNQKDPGGNNVFDGGFLGLDNIGCFDRSKPLPTGGRLEQADGTAWMAFFSLCMLEISTELALHDPVYEELSLKFLEHFLRIGAAMDKLGDHADEMWDEEDGFFYDVLRLPDGSAFRLKVRSMVGLLPLCATTVISRKTIDKLPFLKDHARKFLEKNPHFATHVSTPDKTNPDGSFLLSLMNEDKLRRVLTRLLDETEFLSQHGIRSLSKFHEQNPFVYHHDRDIFSVNYLPAESDTGMFGGNSNWRGPIWMPVNGLIVRALYKLHLYFGDDYKIECPTGSGVQMNLREVAVEICRRLSSTFLVGPDGSRPVYGKDERFSKDPRWRDHVLFYEYFHGDTGLGLGASHQTGWTGLVAKFLEIQGTKGARTSKPKA